LSIEVELYLEFPLSEPSPANTISFGISRSQASEIKLAGLGSLMYPEDFYVPHTRKIRGGLNLNLN
jgi:hypothetical protein